MPVILMARYEPGVKTKVSSDCFSKILYFYSVWELHSQGLLPALSWEQCLESLKPGSAPGTMRYWGLGLSHVHTGHNLSVELSLSLCQPFLERVVSKGEFFLSLENLFTIS